MKPGEIYEHLERISNLLRTENRRTVLSQGLQPVQLEALHYLNCCNRYSNTPASVADYLGLTKGTVSQTLGLLESGGFIDKGPDDKDRRVVHLTLTDAGRRVVASAIPPKSLLQALELLSDDTQSELLEDLGSLLTAMQKANNLRTFGVCRTCRYHSVEEDSSHRCCLTGEALSEDDSSKICREHESVT